MKSNLLIKSKCFANLFLQNFEFRIIPRRSIATHEIFPLYLKETKAWNTTTSNSMGNLNIDITSSSQKKLRSLLKDDKTFLRITVESGGCHGFQYKVSLDHHLNSDDRLFEKDGAKVVVDETSLPLISGSKLDYVEELIGSSFKLIDNPSAGTSCGCGTSFDYNPKGEINKRY